MSEGFSPATRHCDANAAAQGVGQEFNTPKRSFPAAQHGATVEQAGDEGAGFGVPSGEHSAAQSPEPAAGPAESAQARGKYSGWSCWCAVSPAPARHCTLSGAEARNPAPIQVRCPFNAGSYHQSGAQPGLVERGSNPVCSCAAADPARRDGERQRGAPSAKRRAGHTPPAFKSSLGAGTCGAANPPGGSAFSSHSAPSPTTGADPAAAARSHQAAAVTFSKARHPYLTAHALAVTARRING